MSFMHDAQQGMIYETHEENSFHLISIIVHQSAKKESNKKSLQGQMESLKIGILDCWIRSPEELQIAVTKH